MDEFALVPLGRKALYLSSALLISVTWIGASPNAGRAEGGTTEQSTVLAAIERKIFCQTYSQEDFETRLNRVEKRVFGQSIGGTQGQRLERLAAVAQPQVEPGDTPVTSNSQVAQPVIDAQETAGTPVKTRAAASTKQSKPTPDEDDCAIERARVSVMAAKEEEIRQLLADGVNLWRASRGQEAIEKFEQAVRLDPHNAEAHFSMGIIEETQGNLVEAASSYRLASKSRPDNADYRSAISAVEKKLASRQKVDTSKAEIQRLAEDAIGAYKRGEYLSALDLYKDIDQKTPNQHLIKYNIGTVYLVLKQPERALEFYKQALRLNPQESKYAEALEGLEVVVSRNKAQLKEQAKQYKETSSGGTQSASAKQTNHGPIASYGLLGRSGSGGVVITTIGIASRASKIGIQPGDIIRAVDGTVVKNIGDVNDILARKNPGAPVQMVIQRENQIAQVLL